MPEPAPPGGEKKRPDKLGAKGSAAGPPVPRSLPVQRKVEPSSLDPAEEPLLWEGLTLNKCILVASVVALLSVTFQVLQAPCAREGISPTRQDPPPPPLHVTLRAKEEQVRAKEEQVRAAVTPRPTQPSIVLEDEDVGDGTGDDDSQADSNLGEPWIFKKWFGRSIAEDKEEGEDKGEDEDKGEGDDEDEDSGEDEEPADVPEEPAPAKEVRKSREKKLPRKEDKGRQGRAGQRQAERSSRRDARAKDRAQADKPGRAPREPERLPPKKRSREGKESRRERDEPRKKDGKGRSGRAGGSGEGSKRDWRQPKGRKPWEPWEPAPSPGRAREGSRSN